MNVHPFMLYSNDHNFNCPNCGKVQFENFWLPKYTNKYEPVFTFNCLGCNTDICITFIDDKLYTFRLAWFNQWYTLSLRQLGKLKKKIKNFNLNKMAKKINIESHVKRYEGVSINDKIRLIEALNASIEEDKKKLRAKLQQDIEILDAGGIPQDEEPDIETDEEPEPTADTLLDGETFPDNISDDLTGNGEPEQVATGRRKRK